MTKKHVIGGMIILIAVSLAAAFYFYPKLKSRFVVDLNQSEAATLTQVTFQPSNIDVPNPERGFYGGTDISIVNYDYVRNSGLTLAHIYYRLDSYRTSPLPQSYLDQITASFQKARQAGIKLIPAFTYNYPTESYSDTTTDQIMAHIQQLTPIFVANKDVIAFFEAGFIGYWGEWHHSTNNSDSPSSETAIIDALISALPSDRMVGIRYPSDLRRLQSSGPITSSEAFNGSKRARLGSLQACFLASDDDWGTWGLAYDYVTQTWPASGYTIAEDKAYIAANGQYAVVGGETCNPNPPRSDCLTAKAELEMLHFTYLNSRYHPTVIQGFKDQGCYDEIGRRLGYRFELQNASFTQSAKPGDTFQLNFQLINKGYAAMYNPRQVYAVIYDPNDNSKVYPFNLNIDPRSWQPGNTVNVSKSFTVPNNISSGNYSLALILPDSSSSLQTDSRYAVQFANQNTWDSVRGFNILGATTIASSVALPTISSFIASPSTVTSGQPSTLSWSVSGATSLSINQNVGTVTGTSKVVNPIQTTTYTLTATNSGGSVTSSTTVTVNSSVPQNQLPAGNFDEIRLSDGVVRGWSYDPDNTSVSNTVQIFFNGPVGTGTMVSSSATNVLRSDVNSSFGISGNHGFEFTIPANYRDGVSHSVYVYGIDMNDSTKSTLLAGSPKSFTLTVADTTAPSIPTNLSAVATSTSSINLSWVSSTDNVAVTGYKIFRNNAQITTTNTNNYLDTGLTAATSYSYKISAYDAAGNNSSQTSSVSATTQSNPPSFDFSLSTPSNKSVTQGSTVSNLISSTLISGTASSVSFQAQGLPSGVTPSFSPASCSPSCSTTLTLSASTTAVIGTSTITIVAASVSFSHATTFTLTVNSSSGGGGGSSGGSGGGGSTGGTGGSTQPAPSVVFKDGTLINDHGTIYVIEYGQKRGIVSMNVFNGFGYKWSNVISTDISSISTGPVLVSASQRHVRGTLAVLNGTVYFLGANFKYPFPSAEVFYSWSNNFKDVVNGNSFDTAIPTGAIVGMKP